MATSRSPSNWKSWITPSSLSSNRPYRKHWSRQFTTCQTKTGKTTETQQAIWKLFYTDVAEFIHHVLGCTFQIVLPITGFTGSYQHGVHQIPCDSIFFGHSIGEQTILRWIDPLLTRRSWVESKWMIWIWGWERVLSVMAVYSSSFERWNVCITLIMDLISHSSYRESSCILPNRQHPHLSLRVYFSLTPPLHHSSTFESTTRSRFK